MVTLRKLQRKDTKLRKHKRVPQKLKVYADVFKIGCVQ